MDDDLRPDPDALLEQIQKSEEENGRGKLKIFFGYAAGVGKTYTMLDSAHSAMKEGIDVVVGYVEPHTRPETIALLEGLEVLPPLKVAYKGITLNEFDLDRALERKPQLILVDELAHTNAAGLRHTKRYSDIEELLDSGIDVWTTVNVQHIESLNDIVASITQVTVQERVPDRIFDKASQVELIDIEPVELEGRLEAGKVYQGNKAKRAIANFFTRENLDALREVALRHTADRVNKEVEINKGTRATAAYCTNEHILVCLSPSYSNSKVIRSAARMADAFHGDFTAIYVETPNANKLNEEGKKRIRDNMKLAEELGAHVISTYGSDVPFQIAEFARVSGVSKIIIGRTKRKMYLFKSQQNFIDKLIHFAQNIDIYVIPDKAHNQYKKKSLHLSKPKVTGKDVVFTFLVMSIAIGIGVFFWKVGFRESNIITVLILGVLIISNQTRGLFCGVMASLIGVLSFNFLFTEPRFTFNAYGPEYPLTFLVMLIAAIITTTLTTKVQEQANASALNAYWTGILLDTSRELQKANTVDDIAAQAQMQLYKLLESPIVFYTVQDGKIKKLYHFQYEDGTMLENKYTSGEEQAVVSWVIKNKKHAGIATDTLPGSLALYKPILDGKNHVLAVVGIVITDEKYVEYSGKSVLTAMLNQVAFALEKISINEAQKAAQTQVENERFRANLLRAVSHDLRTPLTSISGSANALLSNHFDEETKKKLTLDIYDDSLWLINLVENLLSVSRIDNGTVSLKTEPQIVEEIITEALAHINRKSKEYKIGVNIEDEVLMVEADVRLIVQVIINIVDNAMKYTPVGSVVVISAFRRDEKAVAIEIADNGNGINSRDKDCIFDMFFTTDGNKGDSRRGLGLGLALCQSILNAHGGEIYVKDNKPKGTIFGFTLPLVEVKENENIDFSH